MQQRGQGAFSTLEKAREKSCSPHELSVSKACNRTWLAVGDRWATAWTGTDSSSQCCLLSQPPVTQWQSYRLNTNTRTGYWRTNTRTTKTDTSLLLNLEFFFLFSFSSFSLSACLAHCCLVYHFCLLISLLLFFSVFSFLLSLSMLV
jgi:hypothetical protein